MDWYEKLTGGRAPDASRPIGNRPQDGILPHLFFKGVLFAPARNDSDENGGVGAAVEIVADTGDVETVRVYDLGPWHG
jgi:hypothetical protein